MSPRELRILRPLQLVLLVLLILLLPLRAESIELPQLSMHVNDFADVLKASYNADLNRRLTRFDEKTGYAIYIVLMAGDYNQSLIGIAGELFELNQLERRGSAGTVLLLIVPQNGQVAIATSKNLRGKFSGSQVEDNIQNMLERRAKNWGTTMEYIVEDALHDLLSRIDPWFYRLDPPSVGFFFHSPTYDGNNSFPVGALFGRDDRYYPNGFYLCRRLVGGSAVVCLRVFRLFYRGSKCLSN